MGMRKKAIYFLAFTAEINGVWTFIFCLQCLQFKGTLNGDSACGVTRPEKSNGRFMKNNKFQTNEIPNLLLYFNHQAVAQE